MAKWNIPFLKRRPKPEFREDAAGSSLRKLLHMTRQQKLTYLRWLLYVAFVSVTICMVAASYGNVSQEFIYFQF